MGSPGDEVDYSKRSTEELKEMKATGGKLVESFVKGGGAPGITEAQKKEMANEGYPIHVIRRQLGHENAATTASYLDHITAGDVVAAVRKREWAA